MPLWTLEGQERYIKARLEAHKALNPQCSTEERWLRGEKWAVYKNNNKKAFKLFDTEEEAQKLIAAVGPDETLRLEYRQGSYNRCKQFCIVSDYCPQWQAEKEKNQC